MRRYYQAGFWRSDTIWSLFASAAAANSGKIAIRQGSLLSVTYGELLDRVESTAVLLQRCGVGRNDIVTICGPNWIDTVAAILSALRLGAVASPVAVTSGPKDLRYVIEKCRSKAVFVSGRFRSSDHMSALTSFLTELDPKPAVMRLTADGSETVSFARAATPVPHDPDAPSAVLFTSGTESRAKGVVHTSNTILFGERALADALALDADDVAFMASPISHATGFLHGVMMTLTLGGTLSLMEIFEARAAFDQMVSHRATWTMGATPFLAEIAQEAERRGESLPALRYFLCGGAPVPETVARRATAAGIRVLSIYGSTESPPHTLTHPEDPPERSVTTDGRALAGIEIRVVAPDGFDVPENGVGEEWSRGPNTFTGYLDEPELTARTLDTDGWYRSGDLARRLPCGFVRITGRMKDIIIRGGQNISAREVEELLSRFPGCSEVAVVAIPHKRLGETGCAVMVMEQGQTASIQDVVAFLKTCGIANYKLPERVETWPDLPKTPSGKIQKFEIRRKLAGAGVDA